LEMPKEHGVLASFSMVNSRGFGVVRQRMEREVRGGESAH
jgi:hypothetical protein